jgi:phosphatidylserine/phosphatidylglycerophosphate/cardiolipin synthase-like enzyme
MNLNFILSLTLITVGIHAAFGQEKVRVSKREKMPLSVFAGKVEAGSNGIITRDSSRFRTLGEDTSLEVDETSQSLLCTGDQRKLPEFNQELFHFDVEKFIESENGTDLLSAKRNFYSKLDFHKDHYRHERPYPYLHEWKSLNHPPIRNLNLPMETYASFMRQDQKIQDGNSPYFTPEFQSSIDELSGTELTQGNKLTLLTNNQSSLEKTKLIRESDDFIFGAVMAVACTKETEPLISALIEKAKNGVDVRLITRRLFGAVIFKKCHKRLVENGVKIILVRDLHQGKVSFMHNKYWIFGKKGRSTDVSVIGGQNVARYQTLSDGFNHYNRDTDLKIEGPSSTDLLEDFVALWNEHLGAFLSKSKNQPNLKSYEPIVSQKKADERNRGVRGNEQYARWLSNPELRTKGICRIAVQRPFGENFFVAKIFQKYSEAAQKNIQITTPDMNFDLEEVKESKNENANALYGSFQEAARRGVLVDHISNGRDGGWGEMTAQFRDWSEAAYDRGNQISGKFWENREENQTVRKIKGTRELLKFLAKTPNYHTYTHFQYIHGKQLMWDRTAVSIGSVNLSRTALEKNHESTAICMDEDLTREMEKVFTLDLVNSTPVISKNGD